jgi:hypothetical protein
VYPRWDSRIQIRLYGFAYLLTSIRLMNSFTKRTPTAISSQISRRPAKLLQLLV